MGDTLRMRKTSGSIPLEWTASPVDSHHDAADYYNVYVSSSPDSGFAMLDSTAQTGVTASSGAETEFYKIVAANSAGTSGDEPAP